jgi:large subunit ribosomal protein L36e
MSSTGVAVGLKKGFPVEKREVVSRASNKKGVSHVMMLFKWSCRNWFYQRLSKRTKLVREVVSEVTGMSPYEKRLLDMLKTGGSSSEKRMYKFAKRRVRNTIDARSQLLSDLPKL